MSDRTTVRVLYPSVSFFVGAEAAWKVVEHEDRVEVYRNAGRGWRRQRSMPDWLDRLIHKYDIEVLDR